MRKAAMGTLMVGTLMAVVLWSAGPVAALPPIAQASEAAVPTEAAASPTEAVASPTEAAATPCATTAAPTEAPVTASPSSSEAAPTEAPAPCATEPAATEPAASEAPTASESPSGFCALLTTDELGQVTKHTMTVGSSDASSCGWTSISGTDVVIVVVQDLATSDFDQLKSLAVGGVTNTPLSGIGDDAFIQTLGGVTSSLYFKKGDRGLQITLVDPALSGADVASEETALAHILAGRI